MTFKNTKSYCLLTLPRTGSELVMSFLSQSKLLNNVGEFLNIDSDLYKQVAKKKSDTGVFLDDYYIEKNFEKVDYQDYCQFIENEFKNRCDMLQSYETSNGPIVVKAFTNALLFEPFYSLKYLIENFNLVILSRRDILKAVLSGFICEKIKFWHGQTKQDFDLARQQLNDLKFTISAHRFYRQLIEHNNLMQLQATLFNKFPERVVPLVYEDFSGDPVNILNKVFNSESEVELIQRPFIEEHESHILNIDELTDIFNLYTVQTTSYYNLVVK